MIHGIQVTEAFEENVRKLDQTSSISQSDYVSIKNQSISLAAYCFQGNNWNIMRCPGRESALKVTAAHQKEATVRLRGMETGISEASKRVSIFSFATQGGKQVSFYFRQGNWVQAREAQIRFPAGCLEFDSIE